MLKPPHAKADLELSIREVATAVKLCLAWLHSTDAAGCVVPTLAIQLAETSRLGMVECMTKGNKSISGSGCVCIWGLFGVFFRGLRELCM